jgi:hypothetical protein
MRRSLFTLSFLASFLASFWAPAAFAQQEHASLPETVPMPEMRPLDAPIRPGDLRPRPPRLLQIPREEIETATKVCKAVLERNKLAAELAEAALWDNGCGAAGQIRIFAIKLADGKQVALRPSALLRCETAEAIADWVREELVPATDAYSGLARIDVAASYHCRPRNSVRGALLSEHGRANALDVRAIVMNDGRRFGVDLPETPIQLLGDLKRSSCARFTTVLGPGSDGFHEDHFHLDLAQRRGGYRLCQWNLPQPPEPPRHPQRVADPSSRQPASP